ncbi:hypothetical protein [Sporosarcina sp. ITBMC105]
MKNVDVYMIESGFIGGSSNTAGYIYSLEEHVAQTYVEEGKAKIVNFPSLNAYKKSVDDATSELEKELEAIDSNDRLTPEAKKEDRKELQEVYDQKLDEIDAEYKKELDKLLNNAQQKAGELTSDYDKDVARVKVGHIKAGVVMATSFTEALETLQREVELIDKGTAMELLAHFADIKKELDELGQAIDKVSRTRYIRDVYNDIRQKSLDAKQVGAQLDYNILKALKKSNRLLAGKRLSDIVKRVTFN